MRRSRALGVAALLLLTGCGDASPSADPAVAPTTVGRGCAPPDLTRHSELLTVAPDGTVVVREQLSATSEIAGNPSFATDGRSVWLLSDERVGRRDAATGELLWSQPAPGLGNHLWLDGGLVVVLRDQGGPNGRLEGRDPASGERRWQVDLGDDGIYGEPQLTGDGGLLLSSRNAGTRVIDTATGQVRWANAVSTFALATAPGLVLLGGGGTTAYDAGTGVQRWHSGSAGGLVVAGDLVLTGPTGEVVALSLTDGEEQWRRTSGPTLPVAQGPAGILLGAVQTTRPYRQALVDEQGRARYVAPGDGLPEIGPPIVGEKDTLSLSAVGAVGSATLTDRRADGTVAWSVPVASVGTALTADADIVYVVQPGGQGTTVSGLDRVTGRRLWTQTADGLPVPGVLSARGLTLVSYENPPACAL